MPSAATALASAAITARERMKKEWWSVKGGTVAEQRSEERALYKGS